MRPSSAACESRSLTNQRMKRPTITAIVCAFNEAPILPACLHSLLSQTRPPDEIVVVNNASTDQTGARGARDPGHTRGGRAGQGDWSRPVKQHAAWRPATSWPTWTPIALAARRPHYAAPA